MGAMGGVGSYLTIWCILALSTIDQLGKDYTFASGKGFAAQMSTWHNLLAIWLWRYLVSAWEGLSIPGVISITGVITHYLPSYYLWITAFLFAMLITDKRASEDKVNSISG